MLMSRSWIMMKRKRRRSCCRGRGWRMRRRGRSCGRGSAACPGWAPASPPAVSTAARPPQSRITSSARSVGKSENSHNTDWLNENDEQIAIACVGDGGCWYPNNFGDFKGGLIFKHLPVGDTKDEDGKFRCRLQTPHSCNNCNFLAWLLEHQQSTINSAECRLKYKVNTYNVLYHNYLWALPLCVASPGWGHWTPILQFCLILSWPLLSREINVKA